MLPTERKRDEGLPFYPSKNDLSGVKAGIGLKMDVGETQEKRGKEKKRRLCRRISKYSNDQTNVVKKILRGMNS